MLNNYSITTLLFIEVLSGIHALLECLIAEEFAFLAVIIVFIKMISSFSKRSRSFFIMESPIVSISSFGSSLMSGKIYNLQLIILCYVIIWNL